MKLSRLLVIVSLFSFGLKAQEVELETKKQGDDMIETGIVEKNRQQVADRLQILLANEYVLYTKTLKYHWNVTGKFFGPLHSMFNSQYDALQEVVDGVAERIRAIGFKPLATLQEFAAQTTLKEEPGINPDDMGMIRNLLTDYETIIKQIRADIDLTTQLNDMGTNNFLADLIEKHEKTAWFLRSHLEK